MLHITVATAPETAVPLSDPVHFKRDVAAIKAALLYGDKVRLCSFGSALAELLKSLRSLTWKDRINALETMFWETEKDPELRKTFEVYLRTYRKLRKVRHPGQKEIAYISKFEKLFGDKMDAMISEGERLAAQFETVKLESCIKEGILEVYQFGAMRTGEELTLEFGRLLDVTCPHSQYQPEC